MGKKVLITGASRGIGKSIAIAFARSGFDCYLTAHVNSKELNKLKIQLEKSFNVSVTTFVGDIGDESFVNEVFSHIDELDVLINNAGVSYIGLLQDMSSKDWHRVMDTNLNSVFYTSKAATGLMLKKHQGRIINISSMWGDKGASMEVAYSASKGGLNAMTKALAKELAPSGITVNAISCGLIDTDMNSCFTKDELTAIVDEIPANRIGKPEEVARLALFLAVAPDYCTGQIIGIDGGI